MFEGFVRKYRKKPVVIEAIQLQQYNIAEVLTFLGTAIHTWQEHKETHANRILIETKEGVMAAEQGDYIIKGIAGEFYPCKADIFEKTYDSLSSEP